MLAFLILSKFSSIISVLLSATVVLPISSRSLFITLLDSSISFCAISRRRFISSFAALIIGDSFSSICAIVLSMLSRLAISPSL